MNKRMSPEQEIHVSQVLQRTVEHIDEKYRKGQQEHGGNLWKKGILRLIGPQIRDEAADQVVYADVLMEQLSEIREICLVNRPFKGGDGYTRILHILDGTESGT